VSTPSIAREPTRSEAPLLHRISQAAGAVDATYAKSTIVATSAMAGAYEQSFTIGDTLAAAIAKQFPDKFAPAN